MRSLPLLLAGRLLPVAALATAGWAWTTGPYAPVEPKPLAAAQTGAKPEPTYAKPPAPCEVLSHDTVKDLVPDAERGGKELRLTAPESRRTCAWSALKGYDYRWLDVGYDVRESAADARTAFTARAQDSGEAVSGLGDRASVTVTIKEKDKQQTREARVVVRSRNALVTVTYTGSDFESQGAPKADTMRDGALKAARTAVAALSGK
ncbi:hypothetical protein [Streptomyces boluensis]|uniref:DUF3558 domain-containing protein n=1 Tax=Streptomyces boluensis TaxID=1775135 RepID=A0A964XNE2_9ACTN|nr:hypothetical protein [Streptomyces boluensis]NBE55554.1 hypothetical protein [Streptomyces boluensis]